MMNAKVHVLERTIMVALGVGMMNAKVHVLERIVMAALGVGIADLSHLYQKVEPYMVRIKMINVS